MNLTDQQKDLLRLLVSKHESAAGAQSIFIRGSNAAAVCYPGGDSAGVPYDHSDLRRLRLERLVALIPVNENQLRGKPTQLGIEMVRRGFFVKRMMKEYETRCPLLEARAMDRLNQCGEQREVEVSQQIELARASIRSRREEIKHLTDDRKRKVAGGALLQEVATLRRGIIEVAETLATEGVREFANCLLSSQGRLGVHAVLLRGYTARFASEMRCWLGGSEAFQMEPLLPWRQDFITQQAIRTCEDVLAEKKKIECGGPSDKGEIEEGLAGQDESEPRTWSPVVQEWEALKSTRKLFADDRERIPEADLRSILAGLNGIESEDVTEGQIELAATELVRHYGRVQIAPSAPGDLVPAVDLTSPIQDSAFWKEREVEFSQHDAAPNTLLSATWFSWGNYWSFHAGASSSARADPVDLFKSLAREAARGVGSPRGSESWIDWLDLLRCAKDEDTGKLLYAKDSPGSCVMSERELSRLIESGETIPPGGLTEFVETEGGGIERRTCWDASTATIEGLFKSSANHCLRLRSLAPSSSTRTGTAQRPQVAMTEPPSHEREAVAHREINDAIGSDRPTKIYKTALGRNIDRLRKECGWSFDDFAVATGLDKTLIFGHVNKGKGAHPSTLERYATTFTEKLAREVTVAELEAIPRTRD